MYDCELDNFLIKIFLMSWILILMGCDFLIMYNEIYQYLKYLHNS